VPGDDRARVTDSVEIQASACGFQDQR
jgi:hypothetical protein